MLRVKNGTITVQMSVVNYWKSFYMTVIMCAQMMVNRQEEIQPVWFNLFITNPELVPKVSLCETLTCESVQSYHIGVLLALCENSESIEDSLIEKIFTYENRLEIMGRMHKWGFS